MALYAEEWGYAVIPLQPHLSEPEARLLTRALFAMLNTAATLKKGLDEHSIFSVTRQAAPHALLGRGDLRPTPAPPAPGQLHTRPYCTRVAKQRGVQAKRSIGTIAPKGADQMNQRALKGGAPRYGGRWGETLAGVNLGDSCGSRQLIARKAL